MVKYMYINDNELMKLVAFMKYQTLTKASNHLLISQPALSKSLHKLEEDLHVRLFHQYPNKLVLTDTGLFAAKKAESLLKQNLAYQQQVQNYEKENHIVKTATNSPGLKVILENANSSLRISCDDVKPISAKQIVTTLLDGQYDLILSNHNVNQQQLVSKYLGTEKLFINYPEKVAPKRLPKLTKENLPGIIVLNNMGLWEELFQKYAPETKLIKQDNSSTLNQIHELSDLPFISSNIYSAIDNQNFKRVLVVDKHFHQQIFANFRVASASELTPIINLIKGAFSK